jgi:hypothetical protein
VFFTDREKQIYESPTGQKYDPLRVDRLLTIATKGRLNEWVTLRNVVHGGEYVGDVSRDGRVQTLLAAAEAELGLADAARSAFGLPDFPAVTDAEALETLYHYLGWMEGKGETAGTPQSSPTTEVGSSSVPTPSGSVSG